MRLLGYKLTLLVGVYLMSVGLFAPPPDDLAPTSAKGQAATLAPKSAPMPAAQASSEAGAEQAPREPARTPPPTPPPGEPNDGLLGLGLP